MEAPEDAIALKALLVRKSLFARQIHHSPLGSGAYGERATGSGWPRTLSIRPSSGSVNDTPFRHAVRTTLARIGSRKGLAPLAAKELRQRGRAATEKSPPKISS